MAPRPRAPCQLCLTATSKYACPRCGILYCSVPCYKTHKASPCGDSVRGSDAPAASAPSLFDETLNKPEYATQVEAPPIASTSTAVAEEEPVPENLDVDADEGAPLPAPDPPLRPLASLQWPYVPDTSAYPDPLKRDDPQPLSLAQYEAIATSPAIRTALHSHPRLPTLLTALDALRGRAREAALERVLGVAPGDAAFSLAAPSTSTLDSISPLASSSTSASNEVREINLGEFSESNGGPRNGSAPLVADAEDVHALQTLSAAIESAVRSRGPRPDALSLEWDTEG